MTCDRVQVVLIGDHKQLRPIIMNPRAGALGLEKSLFERYATMEQTGLVVLEEQYRMVSTFRPVRQYRL